MICFLKMDNYSIQESYYLKKINKFISENKGSFIIDKDFSILNKEDNDFIIENCLYSNQTFIYIFSQQVYQYMFETKEKDMIKINDYVINYFIEKIEKLIVNSKKYTLNLSIYVSLFLFDLIKNIFPKRIYKILSNYDNELSKKDFDKNLKNSDIISELKKILKVSIIRYNFLNDVLILNNNNNYIIKTFLRKYIVLTNNDNLFILDYPEVIEKSNKHINEFLENCIECKKNEKFSFISDKDMELYVKQYYQKINNKLIEDIKKNNYDMEIVKLIKFNFKNNTLKYYDNKCFNKVREILDPYLIIKNISDLTNKQGSSSSYKDLLPIYDIIKNQSTFFFYNISFLEILIRKFYIFSYKRIESQKHFMQIYNKLLRLNLVEIKNIDYFKKVFNYVKENMINANKISKTSKHNINLENSKRYKYNRFFYVKNFREISEKITEEMVPINYCELEIINKELVYSNDNDFKFRNIVINRHKNNSNTNFVYFYDTSKNKVYYIDFILKLIKFEDNKLIYIIEDNLLEETYINSLIKNSKIKKSKSVSDLLQNIMKNKNLNIINKKNECNICYELKKKNILLKCSHIFCIKCSKKWFINQGKNTCPWCRKEVESTELINLKNNKKEMSIEHITQKNSLRFFNNFSVNEQPERLSATQNYLHFFNNMNNTINNNINNNINDEIEYIYNEENEALNVNDEYQYSINYF